MFAYEPKNLTIRFHPKNQRVIEGQTSGRWNLDTGVYIGVYAAFGVLQAALQFAFSVTLTVAGTKSSKVMLHRAITRVLRAPMSFFHTTPMGRIINRLTKDTSDVDKNLADFAAFFLRSTMQLISTIILIGVIVPFALCALVPIILCFYLLYCYFQVRKFTLSSYSCSQT